MIEDNRPMCIMEASTALLYSDGLYGQGNLAFDAERLIDYPEDPFWDSCDATWSKEVALDDRSDFQNRYDINNSYVKCLEPAVYHIHLNNGGGLAASSFCEFHRPRIRT